MTSKKQERLVLKVISELGGEDVEVSYTAKGHQSFYFNFRLHTVLHRLSKPVTLPGTPGRTFERRFIRSIVKTQMRHHSEPVEKE